MTNTVVDIFTAEFLFDQISPPQRNYWKIQK